MSYDILAVSDISLGYGSPQITAFLQSMADFYDTNAYVIETDEPHRPPTRLGGADRLHVVRSISAQDYWCLSSHIERNAEALEIAERYRPHTIILFSPLQLPLIKKLSYRPGQVIMYLLEIDALMYERALKQYARYIDHYIFPEYERMRHVLGAVNQRPYPKTSLIFNSVDRPDNIAVQPADARNGRIIYAGTLSDKFTFAHEFLEAPLNKLPFDIFGNFSGVNPAQFQGEASGGISYQGYVANAQLQEMLPRYAFSFVRWNPEAGLNYHYACPNKFFEAIAMGVPPITAPHPQCVEIINQYECGIVAEDYSAKAMYEACRKGLDMLGSADYLRMVNNCEEAYKKAFNWQTQFDLFSRTLSTKERLCA